MNQYFHSSVGIKFSPEQMVEEILQYMNHSKNDRYKIIIGTDSQELSGGKADFVMAIVIHRVGHGGRYFWRRIEDNNLHTLRDRIWQEVILSLDVAKGFISLIEKREMPQFDFEVHIDVGENGETRSLIQELVGFVRANNFEVRTKPDSYAATKVADRHVK